MPSRDASADSLLAASRCNRRHKVYALTTTPLVRRASERAREKIQRKYSSRRSSATAGETSADDVSLIGYRGTVNINRTRCAGTNLFFLSRVYLFIRLHTRAAAIYARLLRGSRASGNSSRARRPALFLGEPRALLFRHIKYLDTRTVDFLLARVYKSALTILGRLIPPQLFTLLEAGPISYLCVLPVG